MTQPAVPDSADWERRWTIDAGSVTLQPVTRRVAHAVLDGGPITSTFEEGALHDRIPQAMGVAIRDIDSGAAAFLPTVWLMVRRWSAALTGGSSAISGPRPARQRGLRRGRLRPRPVRTRPRHRYRRRGRPGRVPSSGAGDPPAYRGHGCREHGFPAPARTPGIPPHGSASGYRRGALHTEPQLAIFNGGFDLRPGRPDLGAFPRTEWASASAGPCPPRSTRAWTTERLPARETDKGNAGLGLVDGKWPLGKIQVNENQMYENQMRSRWIATAAPILPSPPANDAGETRLYH